MAYLQQYSYKPNSNQLALSSPLPHRHHLTLNMSSFLCKRRFGPADPRPTRTVAGRRRKAMRSERAGNKVGLCRCRRVVSEEAAVAERLEALKELMPPTKCREGSEAVVGFDRLLEKAAAYIILLKARVGALQELVEVYGATAEEKTHA